MENLEVKSTPVMDRVYAFVKNPVEAPKGRQRQIVLEVMRSAEGALPVREVGKRTEALGLIATAGALASTAWHLHHLKLLGCVKVINPTVNKVVHESAALVDPFVLAGVTRVVDHAL